MGFGDYVDLVFDLWVDDEGFVGDFGNLVDEFVDVGIFEVDCLVCFLLVVGWDEGVFVVVFGVCCLDVEG